MKLDWNEKEWMNDSSILAEKMNKIWNWRKMTTDFTDQIKRLIGMFEKFKKKYIENIEWKFKNISDPSAAGQC